MFAYLALAAVLVAQTTVSIRQDHTVDAGSLDELKGATMVFVDAGSDATLHDEIVRQIKRRLPALKIVDRADDGVLILKFTTSIRDGRQCEVGPAGGGGKTTQTNTDYTPPPRNMDPARRVTYSPSPQIVETTEATSIVDMMAPPAPRPGILRYSHASILKARGGSHDVEIMAVTRQFTTSSVREARKFVKAFAREYEAWNRPPKTR